MQRSLEQRIREHIASFVAGRESRDDFRDWFVHVTPGFPVYDDPALDDLASEVELAFAEASNGTFDDDDLRQELAHLIPVRTA